ncbi:DNA double-strand break repair helicase HerA [Acidianus sp. RZ1]|uniref:DNA double-strand break repair helicase HerA n=1 Tax=Acidianus sp. RZ1 TaxID=1540082 RepID=UPI001490E4B2|nr:DNA double-strand break repair helicase HerA [Acidianus sp. RZ1]NON61451.1 ATP-binding protein [Acidianus sp. RZ1]
MQDDKGIIGYVVGDSTIEYSTVLTQKPIRLGRYVEMDYDDSRVIGLITQITRGSPMIDGDTIDVNVVERLRAFDSKVPKYIRAEVKLLYDLNSSSRPEVPPLAGTPVILAREEELAKLFSEGDLKIGKLVGTNVEVKIRVNSLARHLAILAATGSGKSNTVAILSQRIAEINGAVIIFDYHGEYSRSDLKPLNVIPPRLNPLYLTPREFSGLLEIRGNAPIQYRILRRSFQQYKKEIQEKQDKGELDLSSLNQSFVDDIERIIDEMQEKKDAVDEVKNKLEEFADKYSGILDLVARDIVNNVRLGAVNVIDISPLDEEAMDAVVSHYLRRILDARKSFKREKSGLTFPVILVIEEAHVFLSKDDPTLTRTWASRIAREGRKFGVGLVIVSQRPKGLDENILSQMTNKIILRIVEPKDKEYVLQTSDNLSEDLVNQLSTLNVGEALLIGNLMRIPAVVKVDAYTGALGGTDPDLRGEWEKALKDIEIEKSAADFG